MRLGEHATNDDVNGPYKLAKTWVLKIVGKDFRAGAAVPFE